MPFNKEKKMKLFNYCLIALATILSPAALSSEVNPGDTAWILTATALVLFMTLPGLALFYGGLVRSQNILSVLMQCFRHRRRRAHRKVHEVAHVYVRRASFS